MPGMQRNLNSYGDGQPAATIMLRGAYEAKRRPDRRSALFPRCQADLAFAHGRRERVPKEWNPLRGYVNVQHAPTTSSVTGPPRNQMRSPLLPTCALRPVQLVASAFSALAVPDALLPTPSSCGDRSYDRCPNQVRVQHRRRSPVSQTGDRDDH